MPSLKSWSHHFNHLVLTDLWFTRPFLECGFNNIRIMHSFLLRILHPNIEWCCNIETWFTFLDDPIDRFSFHVSKILFERLLFAKQHFLDQDFHALFTAYFVAHDAVEALSEGLVVEHPLLVRHLSFYCVRCNYTSKLLIARLGCGITSKAKRISFGMNTVEWFYAGYLWELCVGNILRMQDFLAAIADLEKGQFRLFDPYV